MMPSVVKTLLAILLAYATTLLGSTNFMILVMLILIYWEMPR